MPRHSTDAASGLAALLLAQIQAGILSRRAWRSRRIAGLDATRHFHHGLLCVAAVSSLLVVAAACGPSPTTTVSAPAIKLTTPEEGPAYVEVTGLSSREIEALDRAALTPEQGSAILRVAVDANAAAVLGAYRVADDALRFTPLFPFDQGRPYEVRYDPTRLPGVPSVGAVLVATVMRPPSETRPSTVVTQVYPTADVVPENLLRMYIEFSGPMGRRSGIEHIRLLDESGREIPGAFLPLDYEFWSPDHTRFTAFFDPGRVKRGILPNQEMGRALKPGQTATLVISRAWRDEHGLPLIQGFRRRLRVGPADERPLDPSDWRIDAPDAGGRDRLIVTFPEPLDHGLLIRALGVTREGQPVDGERAVDNAETQWTFTPEAPWQAGAYHLLVLDILEDVAGNQIGRAFEVDNFDTVDKGPSPQAITLPFTVEPRRRR